MIFFWIAIIILFLAISGLVAMLFYTAPIAKSVYEKQLVRTDKEKWGRVCSAPENEEQLAMWNAGCEWADVCRENMSEVKIKNADFDLYGEYYNFGSDKCVIIIPGRCESLMYSYYFAPPYQKAGFNVLAIDTRCHGKSDGKYNSIGVHESLDLLAWAKFLHEELNNKEIYFHGICIGTASAIFALTNKSCPDYIKGLCTEGCFISFRETFKRHMIADNRPLFPVLDLVMLQINKCAKINVYKETPLRAMKKIKPEIKMLFLYGKKDIFSIPKKTQILYDACTSQNKKLVWFEQGGHSHLRINNTEKYDQAIIDYFKD